MDSNSISMGGIIIYEPATVITDLIISALCFWFTYSLLKQNLRSGWHLFFLLFGLGTFLGAFSHGCFETHSGLAYMMFWLPMQVLNIGAVFFAGRGTIVTILSATTYQQLAHRIILVQLILFVIAVFIFRNFLVVVIANAAGLLPVMTLHFSKLADKRQRSIGYGILISFLTAVIHILKISPHPMFNNNDLAHIFIMISLSVMHYGASQKKPATG